jgi:hypothetical protein
MIIAMDMYGSSGILRILLGGGDDQEVCGTEVPQWGLKAQLNDVCKFSHKMFMPDHSRYVKVHERDTDKAVNVFHIKCTGKTNLFRLRIKIDC